METKWSQAINVRLYSTLIVPKAGDSEETWSLNKEKKQKTDCISGLFPQDDERSFYMNHIKIWWNKEWPWNAK